MHPIATMVYKRIATLRETWPALQQFSLFRIRCKTQLLTAALCHYVHQRIKVLIPSPSWLDWVSHWPHLLGGKNCVLTIGNRHSDLPISPQPIWTFILSFLFSYIIDTCTLTSAITLFCCYSEVVWSTNRKKKRAASTKTMHTHAVKFGNREWPQRRD